MLKTWRTCTKAGRRGCDFFSLFKGKIKREREDKSDKEMGYFADSLFGQQDGLSCSISYMSVIGDMKAGVANRLVLRDMRPVADDPTVKLMQAKLQGKLQLP